MPTDNRHNMKIFNDAKDYGSPCIEIESDLFIDKTLKKHRGWQSGDYGMNTKRYDTIRITFKTDAHHNYYKMYKQYFNGLLKIAQNTNLVKKFNNDRLFMFLKPGTLGNWKKEYDLRLLHIGQGTELENTSAPEQQFIRSKQYEP